MGLTLTILAYNEAENLKLLLPKVIENIKKTTEDYEILIIDSDKSKDNTKEVCEEFNVRYIVQEEPYYVGAYKTAIKYAQKELFLVMDADFSHPPEYIPIMYKTFLEQGADLVIGSRYVEGGTSEDEEQNLVYSRILNKFSQILFNIHEIGDISAGFKLYRTSDLRAIEIKSRYFEIQLEIIVKSKIKNRDYKIIEIPIHFKKRNKGKTKRNYFTFLPRYAILFVHLLLFKIYNNRNKFS